MNIKEREKKDKNLLLNLEYEWFEDKIFLFYHRCSNSTSVQKKLEKEKQVAETILTVITDQYL